MDFFEFILDLKSIKTNNKKKRFIFARDPRGCDMALKATWQSDETRPRGRRFHMVSCQ